MTLIGDKFKEAGGNAFEAQFNVMCIDALRRFPDSVPQAWISLGNAFGHAHMNKLRRDMQGQTKSGGHESHDAQKTPAAGKTEGGGQARHDTQKSFAAASSSFPISAKKHERSKPFHKQIAKTDAEKDATLRAAAEGSAMWRDLHMDRVRWCDADRFIQDQVLSGGNHAQKAHWETKRAALAWLVKRHGVPADENTFLKDCVTDKQAAKFLAMSERQASLIVAKIVQQTTSEIESGVKLIAAE